MDISVIASGSNGNSCLVEDKDTSVLIDAGKSGIELEKRMNQLGKTLENLNAVIITHCHHDHIASAGVISRRYDVPVYMTKDVFDGSICKIGHVKAKHFSIGKSFSVNGLEIRPIKTSHNVSSCGFAIGKFGLFTDTGMVTHEMEHIIPKLSTVLLESNHDIDMLINGSYPPHLKQWILSDIGHLSNIHASNFIQDKGHNLSLVLLGHLSGHNNTPGMARKTFETLVRRKVDYDVCPREEVGKTWSV